jgi:NAD-dependent deacetylase
MRDAGRVVVLTGAGVSAESGVPTFRGQEGLWRRHRPEELATPQAFARDPDLVWEWYRWRRSLVADCEPNAGHGALARYAIGKAGRVTLVTQNVDGLHHRAARSEAAGRDPGPAYPVELHGALHRDRCSSCAFVEEAPERSGEEGGPSLPTCPACGSLLRPDVVWFGESLDPDVLAAAFTAAERADVCLVVGTSALVYPAASLPEITRGRGGQIVEVNVAATGLTPATRVSLRGTSGSILPTLLG